MVRVDELSVGVLTSLLLIIPLLNLLFYRWRLLLFFNGILMLIIITTFTAADSLLNTVLMTLTLIFSALISWQAARRMLKFAQETKESKQLLADIFNFSLDGIFIAESRDDSVDHPQDFILKEVNASLLAIFNVNAAALLGKTIAQLKELIPLDDLLDQFSTAFKNKKTLRCEKHFATLGKYLKIVFYPLSTKGYAVIFEDISIEKKQQQKLAASELYNRSILELIPDTIIVLNREGEYRDIIASDQTKLLAKKETVIGTNISAYFSSWQAQQIIEKINNSLEGQVLEKIEYQLPLAEGMRFFEARITPLNQNEVMCLIRDITENKRAQKALEANEQKYRALVDQSVEMIFLHNLAGDILEVNEKAIAESGYTKEQLLNMKVFDLLVDHNEADIIKRWHSWSVTDQPHLIYTNHVNADQSLMAVEVKTRKISYNDQPFIMAVVRDISEEKKARDALMARETRYRSLIANIPGAVFRCKNDENWTMEFLSDEIKNITGYDADAIKNNQELSYNDIIHPQDRANVYQAVAIGLEEKRKYQLKYRIINNEGAERWITENAQGVFDEKGTLLYITGVIFDTTKAKEDEQQLLLRSLALDQIKDHVIITDLEGRINYVNQAEAKMMGLSKAEIIGQTNEIFGDDEHGPSQKEIATATLLKGFWRGEIVNYATDGQKHIMDCRIQKVYNNKNEAIALCGIATNITERKKAEEELRAYAEERALLLDNIDTQIWYLTDPATYGAINRAHAEFFGQTPSKMAGKKIQQFHISAQQAKAFIKKNQEVFDHKVKTKSEEWFTNNKGQQILLMVSRIPKLAQKQVEYVVCYAEDITERKKAEEHIRYLGFHDALTGLFNRAYLEEEIKRLDTKRQLPISIIMADLNGLKITNDTYGHAQGDEMLKLAGKLIKKSCRREEIIARWGGDEFVILLPKTNVEQSLTICKRINEYSKNADINGIPISISLGAATKFSAQETIAQTLKHAEDNMYKNKLTESRSIKNSVLQTLLTTLAAKSSETESHTKQMQSIAQQLGVKLGLEDSELQKLNLLITLHDIGKINISEEILKSTQPLTEAEWKIMKRHPEIGFRIARATEDFAHVAEEILAHHENWDGTGYPQGLKGENIPLLSRITAIADAYEVMKNGRPYKKPMSKTAIVAEFKKWAGTQFDPALVQEFLKII